MRVALIAPSAGPRTGSRTYADRMISLMRELHDVVTVADPRAALPRVAIVHVLDVKHVLGWMPPTDVAFVADLHDDYWNGEAHYPAFDAPARAWRRARNRPRYLALLQRADAVVVHASAVAGAVPHERTVVVPIPAEGPASLEAAAAPRDDAATLHDDDAPLRVLFAGRDALRKGLPVLGDALRRLRAQGIVTELRVAGGDWPHLRAASRWWCRGLDVRFDRDLRGDEMPAAYAWADVVALPSYTEAFGLVAQEALLAGRPVVASRVGGLTELLDELPGALLAPVGDAAALASALSTIAADRTGWCARARISAERLLAERTPEAALDALDRAYAIALAHAVRGRGALAASDASPASGRGVR